MLDGSNLEFARAIRERSAPASDILPQVPANYAYLDGSVRHVRGDDPSVIEYPLRWKPRRGSEAHWISTLE